jgi:hypothetical protein
MDRLSLYLAVLVAKVVLADITALLARAVPAQIPDRLARLVVATVATLAVILTSLLVAAPALMGRMVGAVLYGVITGDGLAAVMPTQALRILRVAMALAVVAAMVVAVAHQYSVVVFGHTTGASAGGWWHLLIIPVAVAAVAGSGLVLYWPILFLIMTLLVWTQMTY